MYVCATFYVGMCKKKESLLLLHIVSMCIIFIKFISDEKRANAILCKTRKKIINQQ